ncbi:MAG TPA: glycosyltransferase family 39 protein [bacterium]|nr:glycosyltransferase family 39 protein [bacterium]
MKKHSLLLCILLLAAVLRFWGIGFGLPHERCRPDEYTIAVTALGMGGGDLNPHFFNYPTLFIYSCFACYALYFVAGYIFGVFHNSLDLGLSFLIDPSPFYLISRTLSALAGVASIYALYVLCRRFFNQRIAGLAALLLAVAPLHVRDSHFGVTDVFMLLLTLIALYHVLAFNESGAAQDAGLAALFAGLAASSKYTAALILAPLALIILLQLRNASRRVALLRIGGLSLAVFALAFFFTSPYVVLDFKNFITDFSFESAHLADGHLGINLGRGWIYHLRFSLFHGLGGPLLLAGLAGLALLAVTARRIAPALLCFPLVYYLAIGRGYTVFCRYSLPLAPFLAIGAAYLIAEVRRRSLPAAAIIAVAAIVPAMTVSVQSDHLLAKKDSRVLAAEWFKENVHRPTSVLHASSVWGAPRLAMEQIGLTSADQSVRNNPTLDRLTQMRLEYFSRHKIPLYRQFLEETNPLTAFPAQRLPEWVIVEHSALTGQFTLRPETAALLAERYQWRHTIEAASLPERRNHYDQQDAFYLPLRGFHGVSRPGPNLSIYQIKS